MNYFRARRIFPLLIFTLLASSTAYFPLYIKQTSAESFADPAFQDLWNKSDKPVAEHRLSRPWLWGSGPLAAKQEMYDDAFGSARLVQYFDKSRMELTNPYADKNSPYFITNGLLTKELVSGQMQVGDNRYQEGLSAAIPVAGDIENNPFCPTYAAFGQAGLASLKAGDARSPDLTGQGVTATLNRDGQIGTGSGPGGKVNFAFYEPTLGHNIPNIFWNWLNNIEGGWLYVMGYPISEPYWSQVTVGGESRAVLIQLYERRVLTYNPANPPAWQVEMGNIGLHYYQWRYEAGSAHVISYQPYKSDVSRTLYIIGVMQNDSNTEQRINLSVGLLDEKGQELASSDAMINALSVVPPRGKSPFRLLISKPPDQWKELKFTFQFLPFLKNVKSSLNYNLQPAGIDFGKTVTGLPYISGRLTNLKSTPSRYTQVLAAAYDSDGKVVDIDTTYTDPQNIEPGGSAPFNLTFLQAKNIVSYDIFAEGRS